MQKGELRRRQGDRVVRDEDEDRVIDSRLQPNNGWEIEQSEVGEAEDERIGERIPLLDKRTGGETKLESNIKAQALGVTKKDWIVGILKLLLDQVSTFFNEKTPPFLSIAYFTSFFVTPKVDDKTLALLKELKEHASTPYDKDNPDHEAQLLILWNCSFPEEELDKRITKKWGKLGFQGTDPATDFRGWGLFGLKNILYLAEKYPVKFKKMVEGLHHAEAYPFAITSLNITDMLFEILGHGFKPSTAASPAKKRLADLLFPPQRTSTYYQYQARTGKGSGRDSGEKEEEDDRGQGHGGDDVLPENAKEAFQEVYCAAFEVFDQEWLKAKATYMDFPKVQAIAKKEVEKLIASKFTSIEKVVEWNSTSTLSKMY